MSPATMVICSSSRRDRWSRANIGSNSDDWSAIGVFSGQNGSVGWVLGRTRGTRLKLEGREWDTTGPADRNTGHTYTNVAVVNEHLAYATQGQTSGSRIYVWDGGDWAPGTSTGPLYGLDLNSEEEGVAVGRRGVAYWIDNGRWVQMPKSASTGGEDLTSVAMISRSRIFATSGRAQIFRWNGADWIKMTISGTTRTRDINGIWLTSNGAEGWAVGADGMILRYE